MLEKPRSARVEITYAGDDTSTYIKGFEYIDPAGGESDQIRLTLDNIDYRWIREMPQKRDKITAKIITQNWDTEKEDVFDCGKFCVDDLHLSGPNLTATIKAVSVPEANAFRSTERNKTWKKITLKEISTAIASEYSMELSYTGDVIKLESVEQSNETDCNFIKKLCDSYAMAIKVYSGKIIIYDKGKYEEKEPVATINVCDIQDWNYNDTLAGTYTGAEITYTSGKDNKKLTCKVGDGKRILKINEKVDNLADAQLKACGKVNTENEKAITMSITIMANTKIVASNTILIEGLEKIDGKYFVDKVTHKIEAESAYTMSIELHKVQERIKP